jgi:serine/threonine-protein kinase
LLPDVDGTIRRLPPVFQYGQFYFPSFGLQLARVYLNLQRDALTWKDQSGFSLKNAIIPADQNADVMIDFSNAEGTFKKHSAVDVLSGALPDNAFENKIVLIGVTAPGASQVYVGPGGNAMTDLDVWSNHMENILNQRFIARPGWGPTAELAMLLIAGLILILLIPLTKARVSIPVAAVFFIGSAGASAFLFVKNGLWVSPAYGAILIVAGFVLLIGKRLLFTERGKEMVEAESVETNKMLGLSFQGQGMLDLAFEKFRKCPLDDSMKDLLYNLGLDMERKRQFTKAAAVYEHIAAIDSGYKDIKDKIELLKKAGEGAVFGGIGKKGSEATVVVDGLGQNTTLGRYEIMKELGRGAMGIVYLGKDPKINRQVAIKTLRFEDEVSEEQMKTTKNRFFREAESAGNLTHPNIIRIFDAGEDQEVAYIAMELLDGHDLKTNCEKPNLFSVRRVVGVITQIAEALDYAHKQGVVHRDIKPANIMLLKDGTLRITDFGIARIQANSKTATGAVLGTPAYMSPEQINGGKVDGRADIFSLGVMFFELLTGEKPFQADTIAALLYRIANVEHPNPREYNSTIPQSIVKVLNRALAKDLDKRYQTAGEMAVDLRACQKDLDALENPTTAPASPTKKADILPAVSSTSASAATVTSAEEPKKTIDTFNSELSKAFNITETTPPAATPLPERTVVEMPPAPTDLNVLPQIKGDFIPPSPPGTPGNDI